MSNNTKIYFDPTKHLYYKEVEGKKILCPGVTTIISMIDKSSVLTQWAANCATEYIKQSVLATPHEGLICFTEEAFHSLLNEARFNFRKVKKAAAELGTDVHNYLEAFIKGKPRPKLYDERAKRCVEMFISWVDKHQVSFITSEEKLYSEEYNFAGTMDWVAHLTPCGDSNCCAMTKPGLVLGDIKTSKSIYDEYGLQLSAYKVAYEEMNPGVNIDARAIIRIGKEAEDIDIKYFHDQELDFNAFLGAYSIYMFKQFKQKYKVDFKKKEKVLDEPRPRKGRK